MKEFTHFFSQTFTVLGGSGQGLPFPPAPNWQPLIDVCECDEGIHIVVELPGVEKSQIGVTVEGDLLKIEGFRPKSLPDTAHHVYQMEIPSGHFARYVRLPRSANVDRINARYENGYLTITIPRIEPDERR